MDQKQQIADRLKQANNILVTVSNNPSVDQLASCIGLTLALNKMGKHATALFSGAVPSTIEFLQPEKTIETNIDALRDFIISLDKTKADKLRYKVEDKVVKIYITPYKISLSDKDLEFSQGDFNVEVIVTLGVHNQAELDQAVTAHGRILHDATVATLNVKPGGELGTINWLAPTASSLSELAVQLVDTLDKKAVDAQIATAFLTGIVAETARFSNEKTTPGTMSISAELMAAGANQQLVMTKLEEAAAKPAPAPSSGSEISLSASGQGGDIHISDKSESQGGANGALEINHSESAQTPSAALPEPPPPELPKQGEASKPTEEDRPVASLEDLANSSTETTKKEEETTPRIHIDDQGGLHAGEEGAEHKEEGTTDPTQHMGGSRMILQPPTMGGAMSASGSPDDSYGDPLSAPRPGDSPSGFPDSSPSPFSSPASANISAPPTEYMPPSMTPGAQAPDMSPPTALDVPSPSPFAPPSMPAPPAAPLNGAEHVGTARDAVADALGSQPTPPLPGSQPLDLLLPAAPATPTPDPANAVPPPMSAPQPPGFLVSGASVPPPPPVPPPMLPPSA